MRCAPAISHERLLCHIEAPLPFRPHRSPVSPIGRRRWGWWLALYSKQAFSGLNCTVAPRLELPDEGGHASLNPEILRVTFYKPNSKQSENQLMWCTLCGWFPNSCQRNKVGRLLVPVAVYIYIYMEGGYFCGKSALLFRRKKEDRILISHKKGL